VKDLLPLHVVGGLFQFDLPPRKSLWLKYHHASECLELSYSSEIRISSLATYPLLRGPVALKVVCYSHYVQAHSRLAYLRSGTLLRAAGAHLHLYNQLLGILVMTVESPKT
jgi:hypothetical protein